VKTIVVVSAILIVMAEVLALFGDRRFVLWMSGALVAVLLLALRRHMTPDAVPSVQPRTSEQEESLRRWLSQTETLISRSESTRLNWDRHLRPLLARQFEMATRQRQRADRSAFHATGRMLFGDELWRWVDPDNVDRANGAAPGPGRDTLDAILQRLEQI